MILESIIILAGFAMLIKGADVLVDGACSIAKRYHVSDLVMGLTIVAMGTSAPELTVSTISAIKGSGGMALGNVLGSNISNLCLVLGICGIVAPMAIKKGTVWKEIPFCLGVSLVLLLIIALFNSSFLVSRVEAMFLLAILVAYMVYMFVSAKESPTGPVEEHKVSMLVATLLVLGGLVVMLVGGEMIVRNCIKVAERMGISEALIAVTIVALGTSLPELAVSVAAVLKGKSEIAVGNVVGSNILNTVLVLGVAAAIKPLPTGNAFLMDALVGVVAAALLFIFMFTGKKHKLDRWESCLLLLCYIGYIGYAIYRR